MCAMKQRDQNHRTTARGGVTREEQTHKHRCAGVPHPGQKATYLPAQVPSPVTPTLGPPSTAGAFAFEPGGLEMGVESP